MTELSLTKNQRDMARHALGFDGRNKTSYRNHYVVGKGSFACEYDRHLWMDLVSRGLAHHRGPREISGGDDTFWCTRELALAVREKNEHLGADFRE